MTAVGDDSDSLMMAGSTEALLKLHRNISKFAGRYLDDFEVWWMPNNAQQCEDFIRTVYPALYQSATDRYMYKEGDGGYSVIDGRYRINNRGVKSFPRNYDRYYLLAPKMFVEYLVFGRNLPNLIREWSSENFLTTECSNMVFKLRALYEATTYPFTQKQWTACREELSLKEGGIVVMNDMSSNFGKHMSVKDPRTVINGTGQNMVDGRPVSLYHMGLILHLFEFNEIRENLIFQAHVLATLIDEYRDEILNKVDVLKTSAPVFLCQVCHTEAKKGKKLWLCSGCGVASYCSAVCQKADWKGHKTLCRQVQARKKLIGTSGNGGNADTDIVADTGVSIKAMTCLETVSSIDSSLPGAESSQTDSSPP
jgi:MYND finger